MALIHGARVAVNTCLGVRPGERVLIIADITTMRIGEALFDAAEEAQAETILTVVTPQPRKDKDPWPPRPVAELMKMVDVIIAPTRNSLTHTSARINANRAGARIATMPGITEEMMSSGGMTADFLQVQEDSKRLARALKGARQAVITTDAGTDLRLDLRGRKWITDDVGICDRPGLLTNLPAGQIFIPVTEGGSSGTIVADGSFGPWLEPELTLVVEDGVVVELEDEGTGVAARIRERYEKAAARLPERDRHLAYHVSVFGIGLNPASQIIGNPLEDEKRLGTVHFGIGRNDTFGGKIRVDIHMSGVVRNASVHIDGRLILEGEELQI